MNEHDAMQKASAGTVKPIALGDLDPGGAMGAGAPLAAGAALLGALKNVKVKLTVCVGSVEVPLGDLVQAKSQQVLVLDRQVEQPVDVLLEGKLVARGQLVAVDGHFALRVIDVPVPLRT